MIDPAIAPLSADSFLFAPRRRILDKLEQHYKGDNMTTLDLQNASLGSLLTKDFNFIEAKDISSLTYPDIVKFVNQRFTERLSRMPPLYSTENEATGETIWTQVRPRGSKFKISMYHLEELPNEVLPLKRKVKIEEIEDIFTRLKEAGIEA